MYKTVTKNHNKISYSLFVISLLLLVISSGCGNKFFDPTQVGRFRTVPSVNVILDSLGVAEETPIAWEEGEEPKPVDTLPDTSDYAFRAGDVVRVDIFELLGQGTQFSKDYVVTETGKISVQEVGVVEVRGLTETQLEERIKLILSPNLLKNPLVTVTLLSSQQRAFSILGDGVLAPNRYTIPRYNFKLSDAIAMASGISQFNVSYIYVSRPVENIQPMGNNGIGNFNYRTDGYSSAKQKQQGQRYIPKNEQSQFKWPESRVVISSSEMIGNSKTSSIPRGFELFNTRTRNLPGEEAVLLLTDMPNTNAIDNQVSVQEVLKTLSERSGSTNKTSAEVGANNTYMPATANDRQSNLQMNQNRRFSSPAGSVTVTTTSELSETQDQGNIEWEFKNGKWVPMQTGHAEPVRPVQNQIENGHIEWVFKNGKWVPVQIGEPTEPVKPELPKQQYTAPPVPEEVATPEFGWMEQGARTRLIKIPTDKLLAGDARYNIVIKPGDTIFVPVDVVGEFYIMGNVNGTGTIPLTGRPMTLKQAIAAAGGFSALAWPKRCEVIRRIGRKKEEIVMVDLDKIYNGEQPDFFIKPHDLINVGTHATTTWRAILRNSFRATYGFGFVYDRNFADRDYYTRRPIPSWF